MSYFSCELLKSPHKLNARAKDKKKRWEEENSYDHLRLNGNSLEIARIMKNWIFGRIIQYLTIKFTGNFRKKGGFRVLYLFFQGN